MKTSSSTDSSIENFKYNDVNFKPLEHHRNPAYSDAMFSHMNVMADIVATMSEHSSWNEMGQQAASAAEHLVTNAVRYNNMSFFDKISYYFTIFCIFIITIIILRICYACGVHILLYKLLCKPIKKPNKGSDEAGHPSIKLLPLAPAAGVYPGLP